MPQYEVWVERTVKERIFVTAKNEEEAEDMAREREDGDVMESETDFCEAKLVKKGEDE